MSGHYIYLSCSNDSCSTVEKIYTGEVYAYLFPDAGPNSFEGEYIYIRCKKCIEEGVKND